MLLALVPVCCVKKRGGVPLDHVERANQGHLQELYALVGRVIPVFALSPKDEHSAAQKGWERWTQKPEPRL